MKKRSASLGSSVLTGLSRNCSIHCRSSSREAQRTRRRGTGAGVTGRRRARDGERRRTPASRTPCPQPTPQSTRSHIGSRCRSGRAPASPQSACSSWGGREGSRDRSALCAPAGPGGQQARDGMAGSTRCGLTLSRMRPASAAHTYRSEGRQQAQGEDEGRVRRREPLRRAGSIHGSSSRLARRGSPAPPSQRRRVSSAAAAAQAGRQAGR